MPQDDVDEYVYSASYEVVECRMERHNFRAARRNGPIFTGVTEDGLLIWRMRCGGCGLVQRIELWGPKTVRGKTRWEPVATYVDYSLRGANGERYLAPAGHGRMAPRQVREAVVTKALAGKSVRTVRKMAKEAAMREGH